MKAGYRLYRRNGIFYAHDNGTGKQQTLRTRNRAEANRLLVAMNEAMHTRAFNLQLARVYLSASEPKMASRTWADVFDAIIQLKEGSTRRRWENARKDVALRTLLPLKLIETTADHLLGALRDGTVSTNVFLRRLHNFALDMNWILSPVIPKRQWPTFSFKPKRAITWEEHQRILAREGNTERRLFYSLCWCLGGSQGDIALLQAEDVDWGAQTISFIRQKLRRRRLLATPLVRFGPATAEVLRQLPGQGPLFPYLAGVDCKHRATEFRQRCELLRIKGVTLHSYRYSWAERARKAGYPERFAMEALGHNSKAVHFAYAKRAQVAVPSLEAYEAKAENGKILDFEPRVAEEIPRAVPQNAATAS